MPDILQIAPADLLFDSENPRLSQPHKGQRETLLEMAKLLQRKLATMAGDIVQHGLDPSTIPIVVRLSGPPTRYVMLEGNRRLAAIKALESPDSVAPAVQPTVLLMLRKHSQRYQDDPIDTMPCVVVANRDEARHWIKLRHTGLNDGAGMMPWGSDESARFSARSGKLDIHSQALNFLSDRGDLSAADRARVPVTSFKRLIGTPQVRERLGLELIDGELYVLADTDKIARALMHVVNELSSRKIKTTDIYTSQDRQRYARNLPKTVAVVATLSNGQGTPLVASSGTTTKSRAKQKKKSTARTKLIPTSCVLDISNRRINNMENELRKLGLNDYANAIGVLFRVFIELSVDSYLQGQPSIGLTEKAALHRKMRAVADHLVTNGKLTPKQRQPVSRACQKDSFLAPSIDLMHAFVHNAYAFPAPGDLKAHWDNLEPFLAAIWTP